MGCGVLNRTRKVVVNNTYAPWVLGLVDAVYGPASGPRPSLNNTPASQLATAGALYFSHAASPLGRERQQVESGT